MRYVRLICGLLIAGIAYLTMFVQFLFYADDSISLIKLILREFIALFFVCIGMYLVFANKTMADEESN
jgi:hypothetical protein